MSMLLNLTLTAALQHQAASQQAASQQAPSQQAARQLATNSQQPTRQLATRCYNSPKNELKNLQNLAKELTKDADKNKVNQLERKP